MIHNIKKILMQMSKKDIMQLTRYLNINYNNTNKTDMIDSILHGGADMNHKLSSLEKILLQSNKCPSSLDYSNNRYRANIEELGKGPVSIGFLIFDGFELLDVFGPLEMFSILSRFKDIHLYLISGNIETSSNRLLVKSDPIHKRLTLGKHPSWEGPIITADYAIDNSPEFDILIVPGGYGTRDIIETEPDLELGLPLVHNKYFIHNQPIIDFIKKRSESAKCIVSICTGSVLLAVAGVLDNIHATTNHAAYEWATSIPSKVKWQKGPRWVEDGKILSSAGVSAGIDCTLHFITLLYGPDISRKVAEYAEYEWKEKP